MCGNRGLRDGADVCQVLRRRLAVAPSRARRPRALRPHSQGSKRPVPADPRFVPKELVETADISRGENSWGEKLRYLISVVLTLAVVYIVLGWLAVGAAAFIPESWENGLVNFDIPDSKGLLNAGAKHLDLFDFRNGDLSFRFPDDTGAAN